MRPAIHWWSNSPGVPTGYGTQTKAVTFRLADAGFPVSIGSNFGLEAVGLEAATDSGATVPIYPRGYDGYSQDTIGAHYRDWQFRHRDRRSLLVTLYDVWVLSSSTLNEIPVIASWVPLDHQTVPPRVLDWCSRPNVAPVAMSRFGREVLARHDVDSVYIPHTVESTFRPTSGGGELMNVPDDAFVIAMNAANKGKAPTRKAWSENFLAVAVLMREHDDVILYVHSEPVTPFGIDLPALAAAAGIPSSRIRWASAYPYRIGSYDDRALAKIYTRADVLLAVSMGEGFGIPTIEAQACGTRVIGSDTAATPELLGADSWKVEGQPEWDPAQGAFWFRPHVQSIHAALREAVAAGGGRSQTAVSKAGEYAADRVIPRDWFPLVERIAE